MDHRELNVLLRDSDPKVRDAIVEIYLIMTAQQKQLDQCMFTLVQMAKSLTGLVALNQQTMDTVKKLEESERGVTVESVPIN